MKYLFTVLCLLFFSIKMNAQVGLDQTVIPKSPNTAALDRLDLAPVDLATGGATISYNLYRIKTKSSVIPITLRYHSGGIKVDEIASWVGLGWALDAGGFISRNINGNPDEGIVIYKQKKYYLYSSILGPINLYDNGSKINAYGLDSTVALLFGFDTSNAAKTYFINKFTSLGRSYGTISVRSENTDQMYNLANQTGYWGGYNAAYLQAGLNTYPAPYQDIQTSNADANSPALPTTDNIYTSNLVDPQPDEFNIRIPGYSGKFSFNNLGVPQLNPVDNDVKISLVSHILNNDTVVAPFIDTWMVSTPDGKQYYFGYEPNSTTTVAGYTGSRAAYMISPTIEWYLTKIKDVNTKDSITFTYKQANVSTGRKYKEHIYPNTCSALGSSGGGIYESGETKTKFTKNCNVAILTKITTNKEIVSFYSNSSSLQVLEESPKLDSIIVTDLSTGLTSGRFNLVYDFFKMSGKLKLLSFQQQSLDQINIQPPTSFSYYDTAVNSIVFQDRFISTKSDTVKYTSLAQDYWGYYNNAQKNFNGFLVYPASCSVQVNRKAAWPYMQLGVLNKVVSPTGGQTILEYEPHTAVSYYGSTGNLSYGDTDQFPDNPFTLDTIGGLRIKKMSVIDSIGRTRLIRQYTYTNSDGSSSGHLNITPSITRRLTQQLCFTTPSVTEYLLLSNFNKTPVHDYGNTVNYSRVIEKIIDSSGNSNGFTIHAFYTDANMADTNYLSYTHTGSGNMYGFNGLGNMPYWQAYHSKGTNLLNGHEIDQKVYSKDSLLLKKITNVFGLKTYNTYIAGYNFFAKSLDDVCNEIPSAPINYYDCAMIKNPNNYYYPLSHNYYYIKFYAEYPKTVSLSKTTEVSYTVAGDSLVNVQQQFYESPYHINSTRSLSYNSKGDTLSEVNLFAFDYADIISGDSTFKQMKAIYFNPLISTTGFKKGLISTAKFIKYQNFGTASVPAVYPGSIYLHRAGSLFTPTQIFGANNTVTYPVTAYFADNNFVQEESYSFNSAGNLLQKNKTSNINLSYIWDYNSEFPVAEVSNAKSGDIAYSSFESNGNGNWTIGSSIRDTVTIAVTGSKSYVLSNGSITKSSLTSTKKYHLSYWTKNGSAYNITGTQSGYPIQGKTINGWTFFDHKISGVTSVSVSGSGNIDELRLFPDSSQMISLTYKPLIGLTSECDVNNRITYYEYDGLRRLSVVRDQDRNAVKKICYNYAGQPTNCDNNLYYNLSLSQSFTKNNCGAGYQGSSVTYTVPLGTYTASTAAAANQLAQNDITTNGQTYANTNGTCALLYYNVADTGKYTRNNCGSGYTGSLVNYVVPANTYSSVVSQSAANQLAHTDVTTNGQAYANSHGSCLANITISSENYAGVSGFSAKFTNTSTGTIYTLTIPSGGGNIGTIPQGTYNVTISKTGNSIEYYFGICGFGTDGVATSATFSNVTIDNSCSNVIIDFAL